MIKLLGNPKSTQNCYRHTCRGKFASVFMSSICKDLKQDYQWQAKQQWKKRPTNKPLEVCLDLYHGTKRKSDVDNFNKLVLDSLTGIVWNDDSQIKRLSIEKHYDKNEPRIEVEIYELE